MIKNQSSKFNLPENQIYLNCAYMSPMLKSVEEAGIRGIRNKRNPAEISPKHFFIESDLLRREFAKLINTQESQRVAIIPSVSYGMANVINNIHVGKGENIILTAEQFPSNYYPWKSLCDDTGAEIKTIKPPKALQDRGKIWNESLLDAIDGRTKVVALGHVHWTDGTLFNLSAIRKRTREVGALLIVDGTQSVGALPFDVNEIQPDALICAGYKWLLGPYSLGLAYYGEYFDQGRPIEENWINRADSENFGGLINYNNNYQPGALRFEVGEHSNFILVPMLLEALKQVNAWGPQNIQDYCKQISHIALKRLQTRDFYVEGDDYRAQHLTGIRSLQKFNVTRLKQLLTRDNILVSIRGESVRIAPHIYNSEDHLQKLVDTLLEL